MYLIKKVSEISGVSVRTLHHYDEIGLLSPKKHENGYRYYSEEDISLLQMILFYKYLEFPLKEIKDMLRQGKGELLPHLKRQLVLMREEKRRLLTLIDTLEKTIEFQERRVDMSMEDKFKGFTYQDNEKYRQAAIEAYGKEVIENAEKKHKGKEQEIADGFNKIFFAFSENMTNGLPATATENVKLAEELREHICTYSFDCSLDIFSSIGHGYVENPEFKFNMDKFGKGTAQYVCDAIQEYTGKKKS